MVKDKQGYNGGTNWATGNTNRGGVPLTDERLAEYASLFSERLDDKTPVWLLGWAEVAKKGGDELLAEVRRLREQVRLIQSTVDDFYDDPGPEAPEYLHDISNVLRGIYDEEMI